MFVQTLFIAIEKKRWLFICRTYRLTCEQRNVYMTILEVSRTIYCLFCGLNGRIIHTVPENLCKLPRFNMAPADVGLVRKDAANTGSCLHCFLHCHLENRFWPQMNTFLIAITKSVVLNWLFYDTLKWKYSKIYIISECRHIFSIKKFHTNKIKLHVDTDKPHLAFWMSL